MFTKKTVEDIEVAGKTVLLRVDFNVPLSGSDGTVEDDTRIKRTLPTISYLTDRDAKVIIISHLGRPGGKVESKLKLDPVAEKLSELLGKPVRKVDKTVCTEVEAEVKQMKPGEILILENVRFNPEESENDEAFARKLAGVADIFVNDAFGASHRAHASTTGVTRFLPAVAGFLMKEEIETLSRLMEDPPHPFYVVLGGKKCKGKIEVIENFINFVDVIMIGGGMCFTFIKAMGYNIGESICYEDYMGKAAELIQKARAKNVRLVLPVDVLIRNKETGEYREVSVTEIPENGWYGVDIGKKSREIYIEEIKQAKIIFWNGPMGIFEVDESSLGTKDLVEAIAASGGIKIVGGGDSDSALRKYDLMDAMTFVSTGGGACLKFLEGVSLPGYAALLDK